MIHRHVREDHRKPDGGRSDLGANRSRHHGWARCGHGAERGGAARPRPPTTCSTTGFLLQDKEFRGIWAARGLRAGQPAEARHVPGLRPSLHFIRPAPSPAGFILLMAIDGATGGGDAAFRLLPYGFVPQWQAAVSRSAVGGPSRRTRSTRAEAHLHHHRPLRARHLTRGARGGHAGLRIAACGSRSMTVVPSSLRRCSGAGPTVADSSRGHRGCRLARRTADPMRLRVGCAAWPWGCRGCGL